MNVKATLWTSVKRKNGSSQVRIYVYAKGKKKYYGTGINLNPENWSESKQKVIGLPKYLKDNYNALIESMKITYIQKLTRGVPADQMESKDSNAESLIAFLNQYIVEMESGLHNINKSTIQSYNSVKTRLNQFMKWKNINDLKFDEITMDWYREYFSWVKENQFGIHSFDKAIKVLKRIMKVAQERELHDNTVYLKSGFRRHKTTTDKIYISPEEIEMIEQVDLKGMDHLARERDRFLISYYFVMRWEDSTLINRESVVEHFGLNYSYVAKKTGIKCIVPISQKAKAILEARNYDLGNDSNQKANFKIKEVGMLAGLTQTVNQNGIRAPKYKFITTHTARRSAATNLYLEGMDLETIARVGGWKKLQTLKIYLKASGLEVAQNAKKFDFFK